MYRKPHPQSYKTQPYPGLALQKLRFQGDLNLYNNNNKDNDNDDDNNNDNDNDDDDDDDNNNDNQKTVLRKHAR